MPISIQQNHDQQKKMLQAKMDCNLSYQSLQTTFGQIQSDSDNEQFTIDLSDSQQQNSTSLISYQSDKSSQAYVSTQIHSYQLNQIKKYQFSSIKKIHEEIVIQSLINRKQQTMFKNSRLRIYKINLQTRQWKLSLWQKMVEKNPKGQKHFKTLKTIIFKQEIKDDVKQPREISFHRCQCGRASLKKKYLYIHLKQTQHKFLLSIDTKGQRIYQQKMYFSFGSDMKIYKFDKNYLYRSFQTFFIQGDIHFIQIHEKKNQQFVKALLLLKNIQISFEAIKQKQIDQLFTKKWTQIYQSLHQIHKGDEQLCHKCLTLEQHIYLFSLGLNGFINKNRKLIFGQMQIKHVNSINAFLRILLQNIIDKKYDPPEWLKIINIKIIFQIFKSIRKLLMKFLSAFEYIDLSDFQTEEICQ